MIYYVKHRLRDDSVETFRCPDHANARRICRAFEEVNQLAWVQDEQGRQVPEWDTNA